MPTHPKPWQLDKRMLQLEMELERVVQREANRHAAASNGGAATMSDEPRQSVSQQSAEAVLLRVSQAQVPCVDRTIRRHEPSPL